MQNKNSENEVVTKGILKSELKIAFDDFALIINGAFAHQQKYMDKKFGEIDLRFDKVEGRLDNVENGLKGVEVRLDKVEYKVDVLQDGMVISNGNQKRFEKRIEKLEVAAAI